MRSNRKSYIGSIFRRNRSQSRVKKDNYPALSASNGYSLSTSGSHLGLTRFLSFEPDSLAFILDFDSAEEESDKSRNEAEENKSKRVAAGSTQRRSLRSKLKRNGPFDSALHSSASFRPGLTRFISFVSDPSAPILDIDSAEEESNETDDEVEESKSRRGTAKATQKCPTRSKSRRAGSCKPASENSSHSLGSTETQVSKSTQEHSLRRQFTRVSLYKPALKSSSQSSDSTGRSSANGKRKLFPWFKSASNTPTTPITMTAPTSLATSAVPITSITQTLENHSLEEEWWMNHGRYLLTGIPPSPRDGKSYSILPAMTLYAMDLTWSREGGLSFNSPVSQLIMENGWFDQEIRRSHNTPYDFNLKFNNKTIVAAARELIEAPLHSKAALPPVRHVKTLKASRSIAYSEAMEVIIRLPECIVDNSELRWDIDMWTDRASLRMQPRLANALMALVECRMDPNARVLRKKKFLQSMREWVVILDQNRNIDIAANYVKNRRHCHPIDMFKDSADVLDEWKISRSEDDYDRIAKDKIVLFGTRDSKANYFIDGPDIPAEDILIQLSYRKDLNEKIICRCGKEKGPVQYLPFNYLSLTSRQKKKLTASKATNSRGTPRVDGPVYCYGFRCWQGEDTSIQSLKRSGYFIYAVPRDDRVQWDHHTQAKPPFGWICTRYSPCHQCSSARQVSGRWREDFIGETLDIDCLLYPDGCKDFGLPPEQEKRSKALPCLTSGPDDSKHSKPRAKGKEPQTKQKPGAKTDVKGKGKAIAIEDNSEDEILAPPQENMAGSSNAPLIIGSM